MRYYAFLLTKFAFVLLLANGAFREQDSSMPGDDNLLPEEKCEEKERCLEQHEEPVEEDEPGMTKVLLYWRDNDFYKTKDGPRIADEMLKSVIDFLAKNCATPAKVKVKPLKAIGEAVLSGIPIDCAVALSTFLKDPQLNPDIKYAEPEESAEVFM